MATCNPFRVGDKVKLLKSSYDFNPTLWMKYEGFRYSIVTWVFDGQISTTEDSRPQHYSHFELYKEPEQEAMNQQQKTKRIPFSEEAYNKYKDVAKVWLGSCECERFAFMTNGKGCVGDGEWSQGFALYSPKGDTDVYHHSVWAFELEIPITTKRIPFNPELKAAKVVCRHTSDELSEWVYMMSGVVCGVIKHEGGDYTTKLYHPNTLQMEIEEDV